MSPSIRTTETQVLRSAEELVGRALPAGWRMRLRRLRPSRRGDQPDGVLTLTAPGGERVVYVIEVKDSVTAPVLRSAIEQLRTHVAAADERTLPLLISGYLSPRAQDMLIEQ